MKDLFSRIILFQISIPSHQGIRKLTSKFNLFHILEFMYLFHCSKLPVYFYRMNYTKKIFGMSTSIITVDCGLHQILFGHI